MRTPSRGAFGARVGAIALVALSAFTLVACGEAAPSVAPTVRPTPVVTPDPHLTDPTTADDVWRGLGAAGLRMTANNATSGGSDSALVKRINATYLGWPLNLSEYRTSRALVKETDWESGEQPGQGEAPIAIAGANILVTWGPQTGEEPIRPDERQLEALSDLVAALDRLLSPLRARTVVRLDVPGVVLGPVSDPAGSSDATTADGEATPAP
jgi:hypothetical protein